jgi:hypothetical protein
MDDFPTPTSIYLRDFPWQTVSHNQMVALHQELAGGAPVAKLLCHKPNYGVSYCLVVETIVSMGFFYVGLTELV